MNNQEKKFRRGVVKTWVEDKGFGFISEAGERDVFCHISEVKGFDVKVGDKVIFEATTTDRGVRASNVSLDLNEVEDV